MYAQTLSETANTVIVSVNPNSGATDSGTVVSQFKDALESLGYRVLLLTAIQEVKESTIGLLRENGLRAVVAAGGDGTVSLLANELPAQTPLAILPLGTENLLAKYLGLRTDPVQLAQTIQSGSTVWLDAGRANGKLFLVMASCGFDAEVVRRLHQTRKGHIRHWSYARPIWDAVAQYRYPKIRVYVDDEIESEPRDARNEDSKRGSGKRVSGKWAFVFNVPRYAMNLPIVDDADPMDGWLDLCLFRGGNLVRGVYYLLAIITRQHRRWRETAFRRFRKIRIESDGPVPYQLDGDPGGMLPLEIVVQPRFLRVVVSNDWIVENVSEEP